MPSTVIELVGLPGVGKSTIVKQGMQRLADHKSVLAPTSKHATYSTPIRIPTKFLLGCAGSMSHPQPTVQLFTLIHKSNQQSLYDAVKTGFNSAYILGLLNNIRRTEKDIVLFDQGFYQALWSIGYSAKTNVDIHTVANILPSELQPDIVYLITASEQELQRRIKHRDRSDTRYDPTSQQAIRGQQLMQSLRDYLLDRSDIHTRVLQNETQADLDRIVTQLTADIA